MWLTRALCWVRTASGERERVEALSLEARGEVGGEDIAASALALLPEVAGSAVASLFCLTSAFHSSRNLANASALALYSDAFVIPLRI